MRSKFQKAGFTTDTSYELFMLAVSLLSFINLILLVLPLNTEVNNVIYIIDYSIAGVFFLDFARRLIGSDDKLRYFFLRYGWADLLASVPVTTFNIFRMFRVIRLLRVVAKEVGLHELRHTLREQFANATLYGVFFLIVIVLEFGSIGVLLAEQYATNANIITASDALWWAFVSITTVGYGDYYPVTDKGRLIGVFTLSVGVGLFGVVTGYIANRFLKK